MRIPFIPIDLDFGLAVPSIQLRCAHPTAVASAPWLETGTRCDQITKFDVVEQLQAFMCSAESGCPLPIDLVAQTADEIMMPIALTLGENATIAHAAQMMTCEDLHHILVVSNERTLVGVVSSKDIVTWLAGPIH